MSFNYAATAATALRLLQRFGASATLTRTTAGAYDPATGTSTETTAVLTTTATVFDYDAKYIDGTLILVGDKRAYLAAAHEPKQGDKLTWGSDEYTVVRFKAIAPATVAVLYEAQIRG